MSHSYGSDCVFTAIKLKFLPFCWRILHLLVLGLLIFIRHFKFSPATRYFDEFYLELFEESSAANPALTYWVRAPGWVHGGLEAAILNTRAAHSISLGN